MYPVIPAGRLQESNAFFGGAGTGFAPDIPMLAVAGQAVSDARGGMTPAWGGNYGGRGFATLQNYGGNGLSGRGATPAYLQKDMLQEAEAVQESVAPIADPSLPDTELVKQQIGAGAGRLFDTSQAKLVTGPDGVQRMDYGKLQPIRGGAEELFSNPKFTNLMRTSPQDADRVFQAINGQRLGDYLQQKQAVDMARQKDMVNTVRDEFMRGNIRRHPELGFIERSVMIPDTSDPTKQAKKQAWETLDYDSQRAYEQSWEAAVGSKANVVSPIMKLNRPEPVKNLVMAKYISNVRDKGMPISKAFEAAVAEVPWGPGTPTAGSVLADKGGPRPEDFLGPQVPEGWQPPMPVNQADYNAEATRRARETQGNLVQGATDMWNETIDYTTGKLMDAEDAMDWAGNDAARILYNMGKGVHNWGSTLSAWMGGNPTWKRPESHAEMVARRHRERKAAGLE